MDKKHFCLTSLSFMSLELVLEYNGSTRTISVSDSIDCLHLREQVAKELFLAPSFTKLYFNDKILLGEDLLTDLGVESGSHIKVVAAGLK